MAIKKGWIIGLLLVLTTLVTEACSVAGGKTDSIPVDLGSHTQEIRHLAFNADGTQLISGDMNMIKVWDTGTGEEITSINIDGVVAGMSFHTNETQLISVDTSRVIKIWDVSSGELAAAHEILADFDYLMMRAEYKSREPILAITNAFGDVWFWNTEINELATFWPLAQALNLFPIRDMEFDPNSDRVALGTRYGVLFIPSYSTYPEEFKYFMIESPPVSKIAFSPDGKLLAFASDNNAFVYSFKAEEQVAILSGHGDTITDIAFSPGSTILATAGLDCSIRLWDWEAEEQLAALEDVAASATRVVFSPDGAWLAVGEGAPCEPDEREEIGTYRVRLRDVSTVLESGD